MVGWSGRKLPLVETGRQIVGWGTEGCHGMRWAASGRKGQTGVVRQGEKLRFSSRKRFRFSCSVFWGSA